MIFGPCLFQPSFWTWSLVAAATTILIQWEVMHARRADRFTAVTNASHQYINCLKAQCRYVRSRPLQG